VTVPPDPPYQGNLPPQGPPPYGPPPGGSYGAYPPPPPLFYPGEGQPGGYYAPPRRTNWWSIASLVFGILCGVVGLICGVVGLVKAKKYQSGRGLAIAGIVLSLLWIGAGIVVAGVIGKGNVTATDVEVGDCLAEIPDGDKVIRVQTVDCGKPHAGEVFAVLMMPDGDFPGEPAVEAYHEKCGPELNNYSPKAMTDDSVQLYVLYPTADTWANGDRAVTCIATLNPPRAGSLRG
jgi:hypothetical protein